MSLVLYRSTTTQTAVNVASCTVSHAINERTADNARMCPGTSPRTHRIFIQDQDHPTKERLSVYHTCLPCTVIGTDCSTKLTIQHHTYTDIQTLTDSSLVECQFLTEVKWQELLHHKIHQFIHPLWIRTCASAFRMEIGPHVRTCLALTTVEGSFYCNIGRFSCLHSSTRTSWSCDTIE